MIDHAELLSLLMLKEKLLGYPGAHPALNYMINNAISDAETAAEPEMADHMKAKAAAAQKSHVDQATLDQENAVLTKAAEARARVDQVGLDAQQMEADKKTIAEADAISKRRFDEEEKRRASAPGAVAGPKAVPAAHFPEGHQANVQASTR